METNVKTPEFVTCDWSTTVGNVAHAGHGPGNMSECDAYRCVCGNVPSDEGLFECINADGKYVEPTHLEWTTNQVGCANCGRRIDVETGAIVGTFDLETADQSLAHTHRKNEAAWRTQYGDAAGYGAAQTAFHGDCDATGAHVVVAVCACGANLIVCPAGGNRPERRKWQA